jgi:hypothetical protein
MKTLAFDREDLMLADGNLFTFDSLTGLRMDIEERLRCIQGDWCLNLQMGLPYLDEIIGSTVDLKHVGLFYDNEIMKYNEVLGVTSQCFLDNQTRKFEYLAEVETIYGTMEVNFDGRYNTRWDRTNQL